MDGEEALDSSFIRGICDVIPAIMLTLDAEGRVTYANRHFKEIVGCPNDDVTGLDWFEAFVPEGDRGEIRGLFQRSIVGAQIRPRVTAIVTRTGKEREISWDARPVRDGSGRVVGLACVGRDVTEARRAHRERRALEAQLSSIFHNTFDVQVLARVDPDGEVRLETVNQALIEKIRAAGLEFEPESVAGENLRDALAPLGLSEEAAAPTKVREAIESKKQVRFDHSYVLAGREVHVGVAITPIVDDDGRCTHVIWTSHDVSERIAAQRALEESERRLREAQRLAKLGSWELDLDTEELVWSDEVYRIFEIDPDEFGASYDAFLEVVHPEDRGLVDAAYRSSLETRKPYEVAHRLLMPDGRIKHVQERGHSIWDDSGRAVRSVGTVQDVTELAHAEKRLRRILDGMFPFVGLFDTGGNLIEANRTTLEMAGLNREDVVGKRFWEAYWWSYSEETMNQVRSALARAAAGAVVREDFRVRVGTDRFVLLDTMFGPVMDDDGKIEALIGSGVDVTDHRRAEAERMAALREKETLLREVHHRVKNNLQIISSLLHFQAKRVPAPEHVAAFEDARDRLLAMILVHETLYQSEQLSEVDLSEYLRALASGLVKSHANAERLVVDVESEAVRVPIEDALPVGMILCELLTNVFKYAYPGGRTRRAKVRIQNDDDMVRVNVSDRGVGFPDDFDPARADTFGWKLVRNLVAQIDGTWTTENDGGARVNICFRRPTQPVGKVE